MDIRFSGTRFLVGSLAALAAAVGLIRLGAAPFQLLRDALVWRAGDPFPDSLQHHGMAAACSLLFGAATLVTILTLVQLTRVAAFSSLAVILVIASGAASAAGGAGLCLGASRELASFRVIAMSERAPKEDELGAAVEYALGPVRVGFAGLLAGATLLLVLSCGSLKPSSRLGPSNVAVRVFGGLSAASVAAFACLLAATWFPMHELAGRLASGEAMKPVDVALPIARTLELSLFAGAALLAYGVFLVLCGILLRRASP